MAHDGVWSRCDDPLASHHFDGGRCERVLAIDDEHKIEADHHEDVAQHDSPDRNGGPPEAMVERRYDKERDASERCEHNDDPLRAFLFEGRPTTDPTREQGPVVLHE